MSFAGRPQALLDYLAAHPAAFEIVETLAEQSWSDAKIEHLAGIVRSGVLLSLEPMKCRRCGATFDGAGACSRRGEGCQGGRGEGG